MNALHSAPRLLIALAITAIGILSNAALALEVVGRDAARFTWEAASGPVAAYVLYVARSSAPAPNWPRWPEDYTLEQYSLVPEAHVNGNAGDTVVVKVAGLAANAALGPLSEPSYPVRFVTTPSAPSIAFSPPAVFATADPGSSIAPVRLAVVNSGGGTLDFEATTLTPWARVTPSSGSSSISEVAVQLDVDASGLTSGIHFSAVLLRTPDDSATAMIPVIVNVLPPIPSLSLSPSRLTARTLIGQAPWEISFEASASDSGVGYSFFADAAWLRAPSESGILDAGPQPFPLVIDPSGLGRGTHAARVYLVPTDPRANVAAADVLLTVVDPAAPRRTARDLNGDGRSDLVWRSTATGDVQLWLMDGANRLATMQYFGPSPSSDWTLAAVADLDGDSRADLVWQNLQSGQIAAWFMNGLVRLRTELLPAAEGDWRVAGAGDIDADGKSDLVLHSPSSGQVTVWRMDGATRTEVIALDNADELVDAVVGTGDFDATGSDDVVWRTASGGIRLWLAHDDAGESAAGEVVPLSAPIDSGWAIAGIGDQDGDGRSDVVWRSELLRETLLWRFESPTVVDPGPLSSVRLPGWRIVAAADLTGDGASDLVWRNASTGQTILWEMEGFVRRRSTSLASPLPPGWDTAP